jgi:hypothetical protein
MEYHATITHYPKVSHFVCKVGECKTNAIFPEGSVFQRVAHAKKRAHDHLWLTHNLSISEQRVLEETTCADPPSVTDGENEAGATRKAEGNDSAL